MPIQFGTDGWRDTMDSDFTIENVTRVAQAYIDHYAAQGNAQKGFFVGYDNRENSEVFAKRTAEVISGKGFPVQLSKQACPTQVVSFMVQHLSLCSGVMITASHNPPQYNGFKVKEPQGCSSFPETTDAIMQHLDKTPSKLTADKITLYDPRPEYFKYIEQRINFEKIKAANIAIFVNPLFGSASGYIPELLNKHGISATEINNTRDIHFGGFNPEPLAYNVPDFMEKIRLSKQNFAVGLITDGDGDRNGACGTTGEFINSQKVFSILFHHFAENLDKPGKLVHAFNGTKLLDKLAKALGREVTTTKIGFKYIAEEILKGDVLIGGEESGGYSASGNIPDRDGILNSLYLLEVMAHEHKTLDQIYAELETRFGKHCYDRLDMHIDNQIKAKAIAELKAQKLVSLNNKKILRYEELDGIKVHFTDESWILFRASGTEPLLRIYCEAATEQIVKEMLNSAEAFVKNLA